VPRAVNLLIQQECRTLLQHSRITGIATGQQTHHGPTGLRSRAHATANPGGIHIRRTAFTPATVIILLHGQPVSGTPDIRCIHRFTDSAQRLGSDGSWDATLGDLDGDGDLDAFVSNQYAPNRVYFNNGAGVFADSAQALGNTKHRGASLGDLDGDGDLDAVVAIAEVAPSRVYFNNGAGVFTDSGQSLASGWGVDLGDIDGDCDLDAVVAVEGAGNRVYINNGFTAPPVATYAIASGVLSIPDLEIPGRTRRHAVSLKKRPLSYTFDLAGRAGTDPTCQGPQGAFSPGTGRLVIDRVEIVGTARAYRVVLTRQPGPGYVFVLTNWSRI
jgi:hypothetical protein